ncbi:hypothetical protein RI367_000904 [Sorochytrium milnesiophthora]
MSTSRPSRTTDLLKSTRKSRLTRFPHRSSNAMVRSMLQLKQRQVNALRTQLRAQAASFAHASPPPPPPLPLSNLPSSSSPSYTLPATTDTTRDAAELQHQICCLNDIVSMARIENTNLIQKIHSLTAHLTVANSKLLRASELLKQAEELRQYATQIRTQGMLWQKSAQAIACRYEQLKKLAMQQMHLQLKELQHYKARSKLAEMSLAKAGYALNPEAVNELAMSAFPQPTSSTSTTTASVDSGSSGPDGAQHDAFYMNNGQDAGQQEQLFAQNEYTQMHTPCMTSSSAGVMGGEPMSPTVCAPPPHHGNLPSVYSREPGQDSIDLQHAQYASPYLSQLRQAQNGVYCQSPATAAAAATHAQLMMQSAAAGLGLPNGGGIEIADMQQQLAAFAQAEQQHAGSNCSSLSTPLNTPQVGNTRIHAPSSADMTMLSHDTDLTDASLSLLHNMPSPALLATALSSFPPPPALSVSTTAIHDRIACSPPRHYPRWSPALQRSPSPLSPSSQPTYHHPAHQQDAPFAAPASNNNDHTHPCVDDDHCSCIQTLLCTSASVSRSTSPARVALDTHHHHHYPLLRYHQRPSTASSSTPPPAHPTLLDRPKSVGESSSTASVSA